MYHPCRWQHHSCSSTDTTGPSSALSLRHTLTPLSPLPIRILRFPTRYLEFLVRICRSALEKGERDNVAQWLHGIEPPVDEQQPATNDGEEQQQDDSKKEQPEETKGKPDDSKQPSDNKKAVLQPAKVGNDAGQSPSPAKDGGSGVTEAKEVSEEEEACRMAMEARNKAEQEAVKKRINLLWHSEVNVLKGNVGMVVVGDGGIMDVGKKVMIVVGLLLLVMGSW